MTRYPAFIVRAAEAKLRDALDLANDRLLRYQDENVRLTRENVTLRRKLGEAETARDAAIDAWVVAAGERDDIYIELAKWRAGVYDEAEVPDA